MFNKLKNWYLHDYQKIVYAISVTKAELDKLFAFASITLLLLANLKLYFPKIPWWFLPLSLLFSTVSAYWFGEYLIKVGVPKKTAELGNMQNPQMIDIINRLERIENGKI